MEYRKLGKTGLDISQICLGTMTWGQQNTLDDAMAQMDYATSKGINFFDAAEMYPVPPRPETQGQTERCIGEWFSATGKRSEVVLATKVAGRSDKLGGLEHIRGGSRLNRDQIRRAVEASLERLQTDYIDLYQVHWPERSTNCFGVLGYQHDAKDDPVSIEETLTALAELVDEGLVRHLGVSNETPWGVMEYLRLAREKGLPTIASIQNPYNLLNRSYEVGLAEMSIREQVSLLVYSPLAFGTLSGKHLHGQRPEARWNPHRTGPGAGSARLGRDRHRCQSARAPGCRDRCGGRSGRSGRRVIRLAGSKHTARNVAERTRYAAGHLFERRLCSTPWSLDATQRVCRLAGVAFRRRLVAIRSLRGCGRRRCSASRDAGWIAQGPFR